MFVVSALLLETSGGLVDVAGVKLSLFLKLHVYPADHFESLILSDSHSCFPKTLLSRIQMFLDQLQNH